MRNKANQQSLVDAFEFEQSQYFARHLSWFFVVAIIPAYLISLFYNLFQNLNLAPIISHTVTFLLFVLIAIFNQNLGLKMCLRGISAIVVYLGIGIGYRSAFPFDGMSFVVLGLLSASCTLSFDKAIKFNLLFISSLFLIVKLLINPPVKFYSLSIALLVVEFSFLYMLYLLVEQLSEKSKELNKLNDQLKIKSEELSEINHKQSQFFTVIGHELRTPIISIKMMQDQMEISKQEPYGPNIVESTQSVLSILDDFKFFTDPKIEAKKYVDAPSQLVERTIFSLFSLARLNNIHIHYDHNETSNYFCEFNTKALRQITTNLVKNASIHSNAANIWITLNGEKIKNNQIAIILRVEDDGVGVGEEHIDAIFDAFYRGNSKSSGTGLGLFICRKLAVQMDGSIIYFDSDRGGAGFEFQCRLNISVESSEEQWQSILNRSKNQESILRNKTILLVEDDPIIMELTQILCAKAGANVVSAENGKVAMTIVDNKHIDIVLTDLLMPACDGYILAEALRTTGFQGPIIGITAAIFVDKRDKFAKAGGDYLINKPIDMALLENTLRFLENRKSNY